MKVLIVDYSASILEKVGEMIFETGYISCLHQSISYTQAIDLYKKINPNFVMLEFCRGSSNSFEISKKIKEHSFEKYIIVLAVEDVNDAQDQSHSHGVYLFFDKCSEFTKMFRKIVSQVVPAIKILSPESQQQYLRSSQKFLFE